MASANLAVQLLNFPSHPTYSLINSSSIKSVFIKCNKPNFQVGLYLRNNDITINYHPILPIYTEPPPWLITHPKILLHLTTYLKPLANSLTIHNALAETLTSFSSPISQCYTDGSRSTNGAACAFSINDEIFSFQLNSRCSAYTSELMAIFLCLQKISEVQNEKDFVIMTDSLSSLHAMSSFSDNPIIQRILLLNHCLHQNGYSVKFLWIPGHMGITGNERVDKTAKESIEKTPSKRNSLLITNDIKSYNRSQISQQWQHLWSQQMNNYLGKIKSTTAPTPVSSSTSRRDSIIITRLRIGHTRLTHTFLLDNLFPPTCPLCDSESRLTVCHLLTTCPTTYQYLRTNCLKTLLTDPVHISKVLQFLYKNNLSEFV